MSETQPEAQEEVFEVDVPLYTGTTVCDHYMALEDPVTAICSKGCGHGCYFDSETDRIIAGKIISRA